MQMPKWRFLGIIMVNFSAQAGRLDTERVQEGAARCEGTELASGSLLSSNMEAVLSEGGSWTGGMMLPAEQEGISVGLPSPTANDSAETPGKACDYASENPP